MEDSSFWVSALLLSVLLASVTCSWMADFCCEEIWSYLPAILWFALVVGLQIDSSNFFLCLKVQSIVFSAVALSRLFNALPSCSGFLCQEFLEPIDAFVSRMFRLMILLATFCVTYLERAVCSLVFLENNHQHFSVVVLHDSFVKAELPD